MYQSRYTTVLKGIHIQEESNKKIKEELSSENSSLYPEETDFPVPPLKGHSSKNRSTRTLQTAPVIRIKKEGSATDSSIPLKN